MRQTVTPGLDSEKTLVAFDLEVGGHHASYIQYLIEYWCEHELSGRLVFVVAPSFMRVHSAVVALREHYGRKDVAFVPVRDSAFAKLRSKFWVHRILKEWKLLGECSRELGASHCLLMHYDRYQLAFTLSQTPPSAVSGIYFRPILHYAQFACHQFSLRDTIRVWRDKLLLRHNLRQVSLRYLFCLDPYAVEYIEALGGYGCPIYVPDPVKVHEDDASRGEALRSGFRLGLHQKTFLLFGSLAWRKGLAQLLGALSLLPKTAAERMFLMLVGQLRMPNRDAFEAQIADVRASLPIALFREHEFVPERDVQAYFGAADVILAPYQRHTGMSGVVVRAAAAGRPILAPTYGLIGELVRRHKLGLAVDTTRPAEIARALELFTCSAPDSVFDRRSALQFAQRHRPDQFAGAMLDRLW